MKARPLVFYVLLFFIGVVLSAYNLWAIGLVLLIISICGAHLLKRKYLSLCALALAVVLFGSARMHLSQINKSNIVSNYSGKTLTTELTVTDFSSDGRVFAYFMDSATKNKVCIHTHNPVRLSPGEIIECELSFTQPSDSSFSNYLSSRGFHLQATAEGVKKKGFLKDGIMGAVYSLRRYMDNLGERYFSGNSRALFNAMIFGDKSFVSDDLSKALSGSGLSHIAVVSGMHLNVMIAILMFFTRKAFGQMKIGLIVAICGSLFIALVSGFGASVGRALIMHLIFYLAQLLYREGDGLTALFTTAFLMIFINPYIIFNAGFVLSVLSVLGIILFTDRFSVIFTRFLPAPVATTLAATFGAQLATAFAVVCYFGIITPYAPISNIFAVPLAGIYVILGIIMTLLSPIKIFNTILVPIINFMAYGIEAICSIVSRIPLSTIECVANPWVFSLVWCFLAFLIYKKLPRAEKI